MLFAHGSGSSRMSPRNRAVARALNDAGLATLLFDLLDEHEALAARARIRHTPARRAARARHALGQIAAATAVVADRILRRLDGSGGGSAGRRRDRRRGGARSSPAAVVPIWPARARERRLAHPADRRRARRAGARAQPHAAARLRCPHELVRRRRRRASVRGARDARARGRAGNRVVPALSGVAERDAALSGAG